MLVVLAMLILPCPVTLPMMEVVGRTMVEVVSAVVVEGLMIEEGG